MDLASDSEMATVTPPETVICVILGSESAGDDGSLSGTSDGGFVKRRAGKAIRC